MKITVHVTEGDDVTIRDVDTWWIAQGSETLVILTADRSPRRFCASTFTSFTVYPSETGQ